MAKNEIRNGQAEYGVVHVMEEEMRAAEQGVFEPHSSEAGMTRKEREELKKEREPENKAEKAAPANKSTVSAATAGSSSRQAAKRKAGK